MKKYLIATLFGLMANLAYADDDSQDPFCIKPPNLYKFEYVECLNNQGLARVGNIMKTNIADFPYPLGVVDRFGKIILNAEYRQIEFPDDRNNEYSPFSPLSDIPILVIKRDLENNPIFSNLGVQESYGLVDGTGKFVVPLGVYDSIDKPYGEGLFTVCKDNKWGFIDKTGTVIIPLMYDYSSGFIDGLAIVILNDYYGVIDKYNQAIIEFKFSHITDLFSGVFSVQQTKEGNYAIMNNKGELLSDFIYQSIHTAYYGNALIVNSNNRYGVIDNTGKIILPIKYDNISINIEKTIETDKVHFDTVLNSKEQTIDTDLPPFPK